VFCFILGVVSVCFQLQAVHGQDHGALHNLVLELVVVDIGNVGVGTGVDNSKSGRVKSFASEATSSTLGFNLIKLYSIVTDEEAN